MSPGGSVPAAAHHELLRAAGDGEGADEADEQGADGVGEPLAQLVEVIEEAHPPVEGVVVILGRLGGPPPSYCRGRAWPPPLS